LAAFWTKIAEQTKKASGSNNEGAISAFEWATERSLQKLLQKDFCRRRRQQQQQSRNNNNNNPDDDEV